jgi:hypothetical protein
MIEKPELYPAVEDTELNVISLYKPQENSITIQISESII